MAMRNPNHLSDSSCEIKLDRDDFISSLPDAILHDILSYIPTKFAIRTSVLSKRWKRVWQETPSISIDCNREDHLDSINQTLSSYLAPKVTSFDVRINYDITTMYIDVRFKYDSSTMYVARWIELAITRNAENLSLDLKSYGGFPDFFYVNPSVKQLSLTMVDGDLDPKCTVSWTSLRNLSLSYCTLSDESIANVLSGCPILESLILNYCAGIHRLDLSISVNLTRFEIVGGGHCRPGPDEIVAPHIHYFSLTNFYKQPNLVDVSSLNEANFNLGHAEYSINEFMLSIYKKGDFLQDMVLKMLAKLQNVEKLTIGGILLQILSFAELHGVPFPQLKIKSLTVETMLVGSVIPCIIRLLQNSPGLKKITLYIADCMVINEGYFDEYLRKQGLNKDRWWIPTAEADHVALLDSTANEDKSSEQQVALFMKPVLWNAETLETVVLRLGGYLNATEYQNLLSKVSCNKNIREDGQGKEILNSFKIIP